MFKPLSFQATVSLNSSIDINLEQRLFTQYQKHLLYKTFFSLTFQPSLIFSQYRCETFYSSSVCDLLPEHVSDEPDLYPLSKNETFLNDTQHSGLIPLM